MALTERQRSFAKKTVGHTEAEKAYTINDWRILKGKARDLAFRNTIGGLLGVAGTAALYCEPVIRGSNVSAQPGLFTKGLIIGTASFVKNPTLANANSLVVPLAVGIATIVSVKEIVNSCKKIKDGRSLIKESKKSIKELKRAARA